MQLIQGSGNSALTHRTAPRGSTHRTPEGQQLGEAAIGRSAVFHRTDPRPHPTPQTLPFAARPRSSAERRLTAPLTRSPRRTRRGAARAMLRGGAAARSACPDGGPSPSVPSRLPEEPAGGEGGTAGGSGDFNYFFFFFPPLLPFSVMPGPGTALGHPARPRPPTCAAPSRPAPPLPAPPAVPQRRRLCAEPRPGRGREEPHAALKFRARGSRREDRPLFQPFFFSFSNRVVLCFAVFLFGVFHLLSASFMCF